MKTNPEIFKAYDVRGIFGEELDEDTAYRIGRAYVDLRREESDKEKFTIVVARDMRVSSPALKKALIKGLSEAGADVVDIDLASTPTFYFAVANYGYDGGIIVSASHNPKEYNGFKITREHAIPISGETGMMKIRDKVMKSKFLNTKALGQITKKEGILDEMIRHDLAFADIGKIKPLKVVADPANSMGSLYLTKLFEKLPCELVKMNFELDGTFPNHEADPLKDENLVDLQERVVAEKADFGISTDGDGDRIFFVDEKGQLISQPIIRGLLAMLFLRDKPGAKICYDIRPGRITRDLIEEYGGIPVVTRVGHSLIKEKAIEEGAYFAGESSGHFFLNLDIGCYEVPNIVTLKLLQEFSEADMPISDYIAPYKRYFHSGEINSIVEDKDAVLKKLEEKYADGEINKMDGISVVYDDFWFNVRPSNTEPKLRMAIEATSQELMEKKRDEILAIIRN